MDIMKKLLAIGAFLMAVSTHAQQVRPAPSGTIYHEIAGLKNLVNVLYVAAHPDDENTRLLAWLVNDRHIRTGYLSLTRGDGGQNLLGSEQGEALGLIRTHELIEARKLDGAEQYFTRATDFGFSKNYDETFKHWSKEELTDDAVWIMRRFRPDVVICRFPPDTNAGHGHHASSAIIAEMAFNACGDDSRYSDQLKYYPAWQPKRLVFNSFRFGSRNTTSESQYKQAVGQYVPTMGMGIGELAGHSRSVHKSQGAGTPSVAGVQLEYFKLVAGAPFSTSLFDGIDTTWGRVGRADIATDIDKILKSYDFTKPDLSLPALQDLRKKVQEVKDNYWRERKLQELDNVILHCAGIMVEQTTNKPEAVAGENLPFVLRIVARSGQPVVVKQIFWGASDTLLNLQLGRDTLYNIEKQIQIPIAAQLSQPYWLSKPANAATYYMPMGPTRGLPEDEEWLKTVVNIEVGGLPLSISVPWSFKKLDPVKGDLVEQLRIVPDVDVSFGSAVVIAGSDGVAKMQMRVQSHKKLDGVTIDVVNGRTGIAQFTTGAMNLAKGADTLIWVEIGAGKETKGADYALVARANGLEALTRYEIKYSHLPVLQYFKPAIVKVIQPEWKSAIKTIGYVDGAGDNVPTMLRQAGLRVDILTENDIMNEQTLAKYDAILTGIRAVNAEKRMSYWLPQLLRYASNGGTLVMQYNTMQDMATTQLGPYPFTLSAKRVTEEDAEVTILDDKHKLLNTPNKISKSDFDGWVQERGLYFPVTWDAKYTPIFSMHDAAEQPLSGSTLYTIYGKGHYVYTALSFSRQLPAGNKGAIKLLLNMLSVGK